MTVTQAFRYELDDRAATVPLLPVVSGGPASVVYEDAWTIAFMNRRHANLDTR